jgi:flagellar biogenesis protein FliO
VINNERVNVRKGPGSQYDRFMLLDREVKVTEIGRQGSWSQVRLGDGRTGWVGAQFVNLHAAPKPASANSTNPPAAQKQLEAPQTGTISPSTTVPAGPTTAPLHWSPPKSNATAKQAALAPQPDRPANAVRTPARSKSSTTSTTSTASTASTPSTKSTQPPAVAPSTPSGLLVDTKKDPFAGGAGIGVGAGDAFRLLLYLLPILGLVVLSVRGLKRFQEKTGALPTLRGSLLGGHNLANARTTGGSNIRVVESVPVGNMELSLVEVRGRMLLLSSSGGTVSLLTELKDGENGESEFQSLLGSFADDESDELDGTIGATVGSLDDYLRDTREAIVRSAQRSLKNRQGRNGGGDDEWIS